MLPLLATPGPSSVILPRSSSSPQPSGHYRHTPHPATTDKTPSCRHRALFPGPQQDLARRWAWLPPQRRQDQTVQNRLPEGRAHLFRRLGPAWLGPLLGCRHGRDGILPKLLRPLWQRRPRHPGAAALASRAISFPSHRPASVSRRSRLRLGSDRPTLKA